MVILASLERLRAAKKKAHGVAAVRPF